MTTAHETLPVGIEGKRIILFDGVCKLCHGWVQFVLKFDKKKRFVLCSVQSNIGKTLLVRFDYPTDFYDTMLYVENERCFEKSAAFFKIIIGLGYPWKVVGIFRLIPSVIADWLYDRIAKNRYRFFGRYRQCRLPDANFKDRFLDAE